MITVELTIRHSQRSLRGPVASYVPGNNPAIWLAEVAAWEVRHSDVRVLPLPRSRGDLQAAGAVIVWPNESLPETTQRCVPFGKLADRLYLPVEARLEPEVSDEELRELLSDGYTYVWHPVSGFVAFEPESVLSLADLLTMPMASSARWDLAGSGVTVSQRLVSLMPEREISIEVAIEDGRDDIGSETDSLSELPRSPQEPRRDPISAASRQAKRIAANIARWLTQRTPATSSEPTWVNRVEQWANQQLATISSAMNAARNKEIARLLHLLESDPDRGLRFAMRVGGDDYRGRAEPADRLAERDADFDLGRLGGGGAADFWEVEPEFHYQLVSRYRELANRELSLGRHRRAAYIFAELLGDFGAAAGALVAGRHWREAAVLYCERLQRPIDAAKCLEEGGLWMEAIAQYEQMQDFEKAGDLFAKLDQTEEAHERYRMAVSKDRLQGDRLSAARLLETKLGSVDEAIEELAAGWPDSSQAGQCLRGLLNTLGRVGSHEATRKRIAAFQQSTSPERRRLELVEILSETANDYPDRDTRAQAADCTRVLVSRYLRAAHHTEAKKLLSAVKQLAPQDRLLGRDCQRYLDGVSIAKPTNRLRAKHPTLVRTMKLPGENTSWITAQRCDKTIVVAGYRENQLVLARCSAEDVDLEMRAWYVAPKLIGSPVILATSSQSNSILVHVLGSPLLPKEHVLPPTDEYPIALKAGAIPGMSAGVVAAAKTAHGFTWLLESRNSLLTLIALSAEGEPISSQVLTDYTADATERIFPIPFCAQGERVYVGSWKEILVFDKARPPIAVECGQPIVSLVSSTPNTRARIAASFEQGGTVFWHDAEGSTMEPFGLDLPAPVVGFDRLGHVIAASVGRGEIYRTQFRRVELAAEFATADSRPVAVLPEPRSKRFVIVAASGQVTVYDLS